MIRGFYTAASGMLVQLLRQQVISTNLANVNTVGYKQDDTATRESPEVSIPGDGQSSFGATLANVLSGTAQTSLGTVGGGVLSEPVAPDLQPGPIRVTNQSTDLALNGPGFFRIQGPNGQTLYTRAGNFGRRPDGVLVTSDGYPVLGQNGPIVLPVKGQLEVKTTGEVEVDGHVLDRLAIDDVPADARLQQVGLNDFQVTNPSAAITPAADATVMQGALEGSNVDLTQTMVDMMSALRNYEANQKILQMEDQTVQRAVTDVGRIA